MTELKGSTQTLDFDDELALHLLIETAIFDSSGYELLTHEDLDRLKREQTILIGRIEALRRKLLLETKVRDAAQSLSRLQSPKQNENPLTSPVSTVGGSPDKPGRDSMTQASAELSASITKCQEIDTDIRKLEADLWVLERRLLCHTSRILATTYHHAERPRYHPSSLPPSTSNKYFKYQSGKSLEDFDDRSLYRPANIPEESPADPEAQANARSGARPMDPRSSSNLPLPPTDGNPSVMKEKFVALNDIVKAILAQIEGRAPVHYPSMENLALKTNRDESVDTTSSEQLSALELGLNQIQASLFHGSAAGMEPAKVELDDEHLLPVWEVLLYCEGRFLEEEESQQKNDEKGQEKDMNSAGEGRNELKFRGKNDKSVKELVQRVRSLADTSLRWAAERRQLQSQLLQQSQQNQIEMQKNQDEKTDHEQQILGLTNSLSNTLNELSQISSTQDANTSQLKQEAIKLRGELDANEQHYTSRIEELQNMLGSQRSDFGTRVKNIQEAALEKERDFKEELRILQEEVINKTRALEDSLAIAGDGDQKAKELKEAVDHLRSQLENAQAAKLDEERRTLLDNQNLERLAETLRTHEARVEDLEQNLNEAAVSKSKFESISYEQSKLIETLEGDIFDLQRQLRDKESQIAEQISNTKELKSRLVEHQTAKKNLEAKVLMLEDEVQQLLTELATLSGDLQATKTDAERQIEEAKLQAAAQIQVEKGKTQPAMDANLVVELENLSRQNEELLKANVALQGRISESGAPRPSENAEALREKCEKLQKELDEMLMEYEVLIKASVEFEAEKSRLESQIDALQDKAEALESSLADERIRWLGNGHPVKPTAVATNGLVTPLPPAGESMTMSVLRAEFKKMMRDMRSEHNRLLRGEQEARRRLENELRNIRRDQSNGINLGTEAQRGLE